jgi:hypothetical protein
LGISSSLKRIVCKADARAYESATQFPLRQWHDDTREYHLLCIAALHAISRYAAAKFKFARNGRIPALKAHIRSL